MFKNANALPFAVHSWIRHAFIYLFTRICSNVIVLFIWKNKFSAKIFVCCTGLANVGPQRRRAAVSGLHRSLVMRVVSDQRAAQPLHLHWTQGDQIVQLEVVCCCYTLSTHYITLNFGLITIVCISIDFHTFYTLQEVAVYVLASQHLADYSTNANIGDDINHKSTCHNQWHWLYLWLGLKYPLPTDLEFIFRFKSWGRARDRHGPDEPLTGAWSAQCRPWHATCASAQWAGCEQTGIIMRSERPYTGCSITVFTLSISLSSQSKC